MCPSMNFGDAILGSVPKNTPIFDVGGRGLASATGPLRPRTHVAACPQLAKADPPSQPAPREGLANQSSHKERDRVRHERELKEGKEAIAREIAERNRRAAWGP
jgi:hypothetical protein